MFCQHCGNEIDNNVKFCPFCGQTQDVVSSSQPFPAGQEDQSTYSYGTGEYTNYNTGVPSAQGMPMKWYNFVIWVQLFLAAVFSLYNAVQYFTGGHYGVGNASAWIYLYYGNNLKMLDMLMGVCSLVGIGWALYARQQLVNYTRQAPKIYISYMIFNCAIGFVWALIASAIIGESLIDASVVGNLIGTGIVIASNKVYFEKRTSLFIR